jgi:uncharacterized protein YndB with AHSA1/START domain
MSTDRIEKKIHLRAPRSRVWRALTDSASFSEWFGVKMTGPFVPGARLPGQVTHKGYEHCQFEIVIEKMEPERLFSWRWHPHAIDPTHDYSAEPMTLVVFELDEVEDGTMLKVVETGFDAIPMFRRDAAYLGNDNGWATQMQAVEKYVTPSPK